MRTFLSIAACFIALATRSGAQNLCHFYLANHSDATQGHTLSLEAQPDASGVCRLSAVTINLSAGDGTGFHHVNAAQSWQTGVVYTVQAAITAAGPQRLTLNGQVLGTAQGAFKPAQGPFWGSE